MGSAGGFGPGKLWSLWDMINFQVYTLCHTLWLLRYEERALQLWVDKGISPSLGQPSGTPQFVPDTYKDHLKAVVNHGKYVADQLQFEAVHDRVNIFTGKVKYPMTIPEAIAELMVIREAIDTGIRDRYFYYYPYDKAAVLTKFPADWQKINDQFPSAKEDALAAVDCWALGHNTASVFHLMRVAEMACGRLPESVG